MFTLKNVIAVNCRFLSTRGSVIPKSLHKTESPETVVEKKQKLPNNHIGVTEDGGQRFYGFTYYPRFPGQQDPPYEPSKVLMVERIRDLKHRPYWEKDILIKLGLPMEVKSSQAVIVANTPSMCAQLWKVKHLIRVTPITFPQGLPEDGDPAGARLQDNGELVFIPKLKSDALIAATQSEPEDRRDYLDTDTVKKHLRLKWLMPY
uniref:Large ribosomal subunit protein uL30m n=1 Tax=Daphnia similis TaxID=35528 RepID=A0A4Y7N2M6_9CRUS|nr:EOG090X0EYV [Daphnia similis]SVE87055.1 EOG090X0EYV [Daphnia similis]SVE87679.1 EOG090X0EYV [Daphnia similis]SVE88310.1 EOG090X0EYV [Daphnia similis]